jgi:predicted MPP superfamily phosphohydrolase
MPSRRQFLLGCLGAGVAVATPVGWYAGIYEPNDIEVTRRAMSIKNLPARLDGTTAIQISDLHLHEADARHSRMIDLIKQENPQYVFFTGDLINEQSAIGQAADVFRSIQPAGGVWAVIGNSDRSSGAADRLQAQLRSANVRYLVNANTQIESGLWLVGVDDPSDYVSADVEAALQGVPSGAPTILLAHSPDIVDQLNGARFDFMLAGHTHGGQVNLPLFSGAWLHDGPSSQYVSGLYSAHGAPLYVNRGIGTQRVPIRIGARPEITVFTFHGA